MATDPITSREIFNCVRHKQRNVDNHQYDSITLGGRPRDLAADTNNLARVKHLRLCLWDAYGSEQANVMLDSMYMLTSLDADNRDFPEENSVALLNLVFRALTINHQRPWIRSLRLDGINLSHYNNTSSMLLGAQHLKHLQLVYCADFGPFLQALTALSLDLASLTIDESDSSLGSYDDEANEFIRSLSSPACLSLTLDSEFEQPHTLLDWSTLHKYAMNVQSLKVQYHSVLPPYPTDKNVSDFRHFCNNASSLEQLSISGINMPMDDTFGDKYTHGSLEQFLVSLQPSLLLEVSNADRNF
jgi:hypothetical protein